MKITILAVVFLTTFPLAIGSAASSPVPRRQMVITIDDLPVALGSLHDQQQLENITHDLLAVFAEHKVPAVGFVNESKLITGEEVDPAKVALLKQWLDAGLELGNHSFSHPDLHRVAVAEWLADVSRGERLLRPMIEDHGAKLRYFRHPFLHTGQSVEIQRTVESWLAENGYTVAPVTMDNSEWVYGRAYAGVYNSGDRELMSKIAASYREYMLAVVRYYESQTQAIVGRAIPHILLIHAYALNADHLGSLLDDLEADGWSWISLEEALSDPVFQRPTHGHIGRGGITWLHRWAITEGLDSSIFAGEPLVPGWIEETR